MDSSYALPWECDHASLAERAAAEAARRIVEGELASGQLVREADLAAATNMSRTPAREAMLQLEAWGLVTLVPKKGALVTVLTDAERRDLLAVRMMLETTAAAELGSHPERTAGLVAALRDPLERQRAALDATDPFAFAAADYAFHVRLIESMGNVVVAGICADLGPRFARLTYSVAASRPDTMASLLAGHEELAELIDAGDVTGFSARVREHVAEGHDLGRAGR